MSVELEDEVLDKQLPYKNKRVICPHCGDEFGISIKWEIGLARKVPEGNQASTTPKDYWLSTLPEDQREYIQSLDDSGVVKIWTNVFSQIHGASPKVPERAFVAWCRTIKGRSIPPVSSRFLMMEYPGKSLRVLAGNGIAAILLDEVISQFIPVSLLDGDGIARQSGVLRTRGTDTDKVSEWIRTKFGYVAGKGLLLNEMRRKAIGQFDRPGVTSN